MNKEIFGFKGRITAPRLSRLGSKIKYVAIIYNLEITKFYEDKGFFLTKIVFEVTSTNEADIKDFKQWFYSL